MKKRERKIRHWASYEDVTNILAVALPSDGVIFKNSWRELILPFGFHGDHPWIEDWFEAAIYQALVKLALPLSFNFEDYVVLVLGKEKKWREIPADERGIDTVSKYLAWKYNRAVH